ncbi:hypothetical protein B0H14DRAFT_1223273 [Mycena olivaceomarginata]|nr:hypothetical protein B0H14DRAFT_1223273 [Mycena olivaceomarginata]
MCSTNDCDAPDPRPALGHAAEPSQRELALNLDSSMVGTIEPPPRTSMTATTRPSAPPSRLLRASPLSSASTLGFSPDCNKISCRLARGSFSSMASASMRRGLPHRAGRALRSRATAAASLQEWTLHLDLAIPLDTLPHRYRVLPLRCAPP